MDTRTQFWGIRRLDLSGNHGIFDKPDKTAKALVVFSQTTSKAPPYVIRYAGNTQQAKQLFGFLGHELPGKFEVLPQASVAQYTIPGGHQAIFSFYVLGLLGTGVYV